MICAVFPRHNCLCVLCASVLSKVKLQFIAKQSQVLSFVTWQENKTYYLGWEKGNCAFKNELDLQSVCSVSHLFILAFACFPYEWKLQYVLNEGIKGSILVHINRSVIFSMYWQNQYINYCLVKVVNGSQSLTFKPHSPKHTHPHLKDLAVLLQISGCPMVIFVPSDWNFSVTLVFTLFPAFIYSAFWLLSLCLSALLFFLFALLPGSSVSSSGSSPHCRNITLTSSCTSNELLRR